MAEHAHTTPPSYTLGRHPRRPDHPALLNPDGTAAHTFHKEATRTEITAVLAARGLALHTDGSVTQLAEPPPSRRAVLAVFTGAALAGAVLTIPTAEAAVPEAWKCRDHYETAMLLAFRKLSGDEQKGVMAFVREFSALVEQPIVAADHPDAELLALCAAYEASDAETQAYDTEAPGHNWDGLGVIQAAGWQLADQIQAMPAATPEGIRAKARTARMVWRAVNPDEDSEPARHVFGMIRDVLGESAA